MTNRSSDRRITPRLCRPEAHGIVTARVRPGHGARLLDISACGALIETAYRLLPGASVELHVETEHDRACMRGRVVRCTVVRLCSTLVSYRGAIHFEHRLPWLLATVENAVPLPANLEPHVWAAATRHD